jgi:ribonuclease E
MAKEMLINTVENQECRIAIVRDGRLMELYIERASSASHVGNIYKGRITNVEPAIQAAFVDFGQPKNGFLHISDLQPQYFKRKGKSTEAVGRKRPRRDRPPIQQCLRRGQEVVVQMTKEGIGTKGPTLSTYLSIPGRLLVMMPGMSRMGVSRKVEDESARAKARQALSQLKLPSDMGFIVRTAGIGRNKRELQRDLNYLLRLWKAVEQRIRKARAPAEIYQESDLVTRTIRDVYNSDIERVICDSEADARKVKEFLDMAMPRTKNRIELYAGKEGLFYDAGLEEELERIYSRKVDLPSGGSLVVDQTEALVAIDVNSGRFREHSDAETTALKTNLEAMEEIVRQLRLRDLGGVIVIDSIDMRADKNRRTVERCLRDALRNDRAKTKVLRISSFGIIEMTRQRVRPSLEDSMHNVCPHCGGAGMIKSEESQALQVMRGLERAVAHEEVSRVEVAVTPSVAHHLLNAHRRQIAALEDDTRKRIVVRADEDLAGNAMQFSCTNHRGSSVSVQPLAPAGKAGRRKLETVNIEDVPVSPDAEPRQQPPPPSEPPEAGPQEPAAKPKPKSRRRRGRRKRKTAANGDAGAPAAEAASAAEHGEAKPAEGDEGGGEKKPRKKSRRGRRRRKKKSAKAPDAPAAE